MNISVLFTILIIVTLLISLYAYSIAFRAPKRIDENDYTLPQGEQYEVHHSTIASCMHEMHSHPYETVYITAFDGTRLFARYYHVKDGAPIQIQFHGYKSNAFQDFCGGNKLSRKMGHNSLVVDQRSHGKSEGSIITFGIKERRDCLSWVEYCCERFGGNTPILLCGLSMGAATVLMAADLNLPDNVVGIIADCPFSSPKAIIQKVCKDMKLPPRLLYPFVKLSAFLFGHFDLEESDAISATRKSQIPVLLFHGEDDRFVPCEMSKEIQKANPTLVTLELIPEAGHGLCYMVAPKRYEEATVNFIYSVLPPV